MRVICVCREFEGEFSENCMMQLNNQSYKDQVHTRLVNV